MEYSPRRQVLLLDSDRDNCFRLGNLHRTYPDDSIAHGAKINPFSIKIMLMGVPGFQKIEREIC